MKNKREKIILLYDGACSLCDFEMDIYKKKDKLKLISFVDISEPQFRADNMA